MGKFRQVRRWSRRHFPFGYLLIAIAIELFLIHLVLIAFFEAPVYSLLIELLLAPFMPAYWLQARLSGRMHELTQRERRMELAVTLLPAREYLLAQIKKPIVFASASFAVPFIIAAVFYSPYVRSFAEFAMFACFIFVAVIYGVIFAYISLAGLFDSVYWRCMEYPSAFLPRKFPMLVYRLAPPIPAAIAALGVPVVIILLVAGPVVIPGFFLGIYPLRNLIWLLADYYISPTSPPLLMLNTISGVACLVLYPLLIMGAWGLLRRIESTRRLIGLLARYYTIPFVLQVLAFGLIVISIVPELDFTIGRIEQYFRLYLWEEDVVLFLIAPVSLMCYSPAAFTYSRWLFRRNLKRACQAYYRFE